MGHEPDKWTHPALEVPGLWAGHEFAVVVPPATVARVSSPFFVAPGSTNSMPKSD